MDILPEDVYKWKVKLQKKMKSRAFRRERLKGPEVEASAKKRMLFQTPTATSWGSVTAAAGGAAEWGPGLAFPHFLLRAGHFSGHPGSC